MSSESKRYEAQGNTQKAEARVYFNSGLAQEGCYGDENSPIIHWLQDSSWSRDHSEQDQEGFPSCTVITVDQAEQYEKVPHEHEDWPNHFQAVGGHLDYYGRNPEIRDKNKDIIRQLWDDEGPQHLHPEATCFRDETFKAILSDLARHDNDRSKMAIRFYIGGLLVPCAKTVPTTTKKFEWQLQHLGHGADQVWDQCFPFGHELRHEPFCPEMVIPKPQYFVGFKYTAFNSTQYHRLLALAGGFGRSWYRATPSVHFPFFASEVRPSAEEEFAERQNANSMSIGVRSILKLYEHSGREKELDGRILALSVSCSERVV